MFPSDLAAFLIEFYYIDSFSRCDIANQKQ